MREYFRNIRIKKKLQLAFFVIALFFLFLGIRESFVLNRLEQKQRYIVGSVEKSEGVLEAKYFIRADVHILNEIIYAPTIEDVQYWWGEHLQQIQFINDQTQKIRVPDDFYVETLQDSLEKAISDIGITVENTYNNMVVPVFEEAKDIKIQQLEAADSRLSDIIQAVDTLQLTADTANMAVLESFVPDTATTAEAPADSLVNDSTEVEPVVTDVETRNYQQRLHEINTYVVKTGLDLIRRMDSAKVHTSNIVETSQRDSYQLTITSLRAVYITVGTGLLFSLVVAVLIANLISRPVEKLKLAVNRMSKGELPENMKIKTGDEIGQIAKELNNLIDGLRKTAGFSYQIGKGNFDSGFEPLSEKDVLGNSLLEMRKSLKQAKQDESQRKEEDKIRNWVSEGIAKFSDILRRTSDNLEEMGAVIISNLVKYLDVNQGGLFIIQDDDKETPYLEMIASYAYDRRKFLTKRIEIGEGLTGTCAVEKKTIYLTELPEDYMEITSGLGQAIPRSVLIVPLIVDEKILGVVELASLEKLQKHEIGLVEQIAESIASTLDSVKMNARTSALLKQSQLQAEQMQAQEEEMRQNMEEMQATQEESQRREDELMKEIEDLENEKYELQEQKRQQIAQFEELMTEMDIQAHSSEESRKILEESLDGVIVIDEDAVIEFFNRSAEKLFGYNSTEVIGKKVNMLMPAEYKKMHDRAIGSYLDTGMAKVIGTGREVPIQRYDGTEAITFLSVIEIKEDDQRKFVGFMHDLMPYKRRENELLRQINELQQRANLLKKENEIMQQRLQDAEPTTPDAP